MYRIEKTNSTYGRYLVRFPDNVVEYFMRKKEAEDFLSKIQPSEPKIHTRLKKEYKRFL